MFLDFVSVVKGWPLWLLAPVAEKPTYVTAAILLTCHFYRNSLTPYSNRYWQILIENKWQQQSTPYSNRYWQILIANKW
jgi:hypothetical protein